MNPIILSDPTTHENSARTAIALLPRWLSRLLRKSWASSDGYFTLLNLHFITFSSFRQHIIVAGGWIQEQMGLIIGSSDIDVFMDRRCFFGMGIECMEKLKLIPTTDYMTHLWARPDEECAYRHMPIEQWDEVGNKYLQCCEYEFLQVQKEYLVTYKGMPTPVQVVISLNY